MAVFRTIGTLVAKNLRYLVLRRLFLILITAIIFPITAITILSFGRDLFPNTAARGTGTAHPIRSLGDAFHVAAKSGRNRLFLVNDGFSGGEIDKLLGRFEEVAKAAAASSGTKMTIAWAEDPDVLGRECESSARGTTKCFGAIVMRASPSEGPQDYWSYSIHADASLTNSYDSSVDSTQNTPQIYFMPVQQALESLIATIDDDNPSLDVFPETYEFPYSMETEEEFREYGYEDYYNMVAGLLAVVYLVPMVVPCYHMTGFIAGERESGMSQLIDTMSAIQAPGVSQFTRMAAHYISFIVVYGPAWIITAVTMQVGLFNQANFGIVFALQLLGGLSLLSWALMFGSFFQKAQWSGITTIILALGWGILAQMFPKPSEATVMALAVLFSPSCYVTFIKVLAIAETMDKYPDMSSSIKMPGNYFLTPAALYGFLVLQILGYWGLAFLIERLRHGTISASRKVLSGAEAERELGESAVRLEGFSKLYKPVLSFRGRSKPVLAVDKLNFNAPRGQIVALLGANGSGKSTTLDSIGGLRKLTSGSITIDGTGGLGIAPQRNVLWDNLTVEEHIRIFTQLKTADPKKLKDKTALNAELHQLLDSIGLLPKRNALAKTLSGGQKRKLQLGMMLTGGSAVCCVDEVSTGIDPLSRRNIWDILMAERGRRTLILTTHFLDEADMLADHIAILSKGTLRAQGSSVELKDALGGGYRIFVPRTSMKPDLPDFGDVERKNAHDSCTYLTPSSELAAKVIRKLEEMTIRDYRVSNPTLEDVFLQLAEEIEDQAAFRATQRLEATVEEPVSKEKALDDDDMSEVDADQGPLELNDGTQVGFVRQAYILFFKRILTLKKSWIPVAIALVLPSVIAGLITLLTKYMDDISCEFRTDSTWTREAVPTVMYMGFYPLMIGPASQFSAATFTNVIVPVMEDELNYYYSDDEMDWDWLDSLSFVDTYSEFKDVIETNRSDLSSGLWLGNDEAPPTIAWQGSYGASTGMGLASLLNMLRTNQSIASSTTAFGTVEQPDMFNTIQMIIYMTMGLIAYPPLLALYQGSERRNLVRSMEYSNGVKPLALWLAYLSFDFSIVVVVSAVATGVWVSKGDVFYEPAYMMAVLFFYGTAAVMLSHLISLGTRSQLATWAVTVIFQLIIFGAYFGAAYALTESAIPSLIDETLKKLHFSFAILAPIVSALRALFVALNQYKLSCDGERISSDPGGIMYYGGPILYLVIQTLVYAVLVVWIDGGFAGSSFQRVKKNAGPDAEHAASDALPSDDYGLQVRNITKSFGSNTAVDDVTFGIEHGEIFALLGPNGAGKSTIISLIRGDIKPTRSRGGDILVEDRSILSDIAGARMKLGVCPQFDALDLLTVRQHLEFYAKIRGVPDYQHNVSAVLRAVGLKPLANRMAHALSGGNKRKLSLGIALMGNPAVLLLDEPSSGLDAASKRIMWQTLLHTSIGRSILLTTHSMEEADALAVRVGIISSRMLAADTPDGLRNRFADILHVHLICNSAPRTPAEDMQRVLSWVRETFPNADVDDKTYHGQIRFSVRGADVLAATSSTVTSSEEGTGEGAVGQLLLLLERAKAAQGVAHYSVTPTTLDQVFLNIVRAHDGDEENQHEIALGPLGKVGRVLWS